MGYIAIITGIVASVALVKISLDLDRMANIAAQLRISVSLSEHDRSLLSNFRRRKSSAKKEVA